MIDASYVVPIALVVGVAMLSYAGLRAIRWATRDNREFPADLDEVMRAFPPQPAAGYRATQGALPLVAGAKQFAPPQGPGPEDAPQDMAARLETLAVEMKGLKDTLAEKQSLRERLDERNGVKDLLVEMRDLKGMLAEMKAAGRTEPRHDDPSERRDQAGHCRMQRPGATKAGTRLNGKPAGASRRTRLRRLRSTELQRGPACEATRSG